MHLEKDKATGTVIVPRGTTFADLFAAWEKQHAHVMRLISVEHEPTEEERECWSSEIAKGHLLEQAIYEASTTIETTHELVMLAKVDMTFENSDHDYPQCLPRAVLRILGRAAEGPARALFDGPHSQQIGIRTGP